MTDRELADCPCGAPAKSGHFGGCDLTTGFFMQFEVACTECPRCVEVTYNSDREDESTAAQLTAIAAWNNRPSLLSRPDGGDAPAEKGPFSVIINNGSGNRIGVLSDDFTHDAVLWVTGDFAGEDACHSYAEWVARTLNAAIATEAKP